MTSTTTARGTESQKRQRINRAGNTVEPPFVNEYRGFHPPHANFAIERIAVHKVTPEAFFARFVCTRTPVVLTGYLEDADFVAPSKWSTSDDRLLELAGDTKVTVECRGARDEKFGKGITVEMFFRDLLQLIARGDELHYLTTQAVAFEDDGRPELMAPFMKQLQADFPLRPQLLGNLIPQNINMWMGNTKHGSSSGLHHDHHDNLYILLRGKKRFRLYSPSDADKMYVRGRIAHVHPNGLINYVGKETTAYGADPVAEREALALIEKEEAERELVEAEEAVRALEPGAPVRFKAAEARLEKAMFNMLRAGESDQEGDEAFENETFHFEESEAEEDESTRNEPAEVASSSEEERDEKRAKRERGETEITYPDSFSQVDTSLLRDGEQAQPQGQWEFGKFLQANVACCDLKEGEMLYLPASWFHEVESFGSVRGNGHIAINYWFHPPDQLSAEHYDSPYSSPFWQRDWEHRFAQNDDK